MLVAPMPAVTHDDVCVELCPGEPPSLRVWAHVRSAAPRDYLLHEWEYGGYERQLELPAGYGGGVEATLKNGQLVVRVLHGECTGAGPHHARPEPASECSRDPSASCRAAPHEALGCTKHSDGVSRGWSCGGRRRSGR